MASEPPDSHQYATQVKALSTPKLQALARKLDSDKPTPGKPFDNTKWEVLEVVQAELKARGEEAKIDTAADMLEQAFADALANPGD